MNRATPSKALLRAVSGTIAIMLLVACAPDASNSSLDDTTNPAGLPREIDGARAELLSAFFGLDNSLPVLANLICRGGSGRDGMPVVFSTEIDPETMQAGDFEVVTKAGKTGTVYCASFLPSTDAGDLHTVLLIGDFGDADTDPPEQVRVTGHLHSLDGRLDYRGANVLVTPLKAGPELVLAQPASDDEQDLNLGLARTQGSPCPDEGIAQRLRVTWAGGVTLANGAEPADEERELYEVTVETDMGAQRTITPAALADLGDNDNNHTLCLDTLDKPVSVAFPAGIFTDPNSDLNPATSVKVSY